MADFVWKSCFLGFRLFVNAVKVEGDATSVFWIDLRLSLMLESFRFKDEDEDENENEDQVQFLLIVLDKRAGT